MRTIAKKALDVQLIFLWKDHLPDVILLDLDMPIVDGFESIRALQQLKISLSEGKY